ncbi:MAG: NigD-like C-terminal domain-containing protein [Proteiniphilum sp.]|nr:NigD-like C-terminal domain-containing protein [Proteiniphilum sp.]
MRKGMIVQTALMLFMLLTGCEQEPLRLDDYLVDFATRVRVANNCRYRLDNSRLLIPQEDSNCSGPNGQRVVINYSFLQGDTIRINSVFDIFTGSIQTKGFPEQYASDPVKIQSVWTGGGYLNMIVETEYHNRPHKVALFRDPSAVTVDLWFSHSRDEDPPGYPEKMYASFSLDALRGEDNNGPISFRLFIHTLTGLRVFPFTLPESAPLQ